MQYSLRRRIGIAGAIFILALITAVVLAGANVAAYHTNVQLLTSQVIPALANIAELNDLTHDLATETTYGLLSNTSNETTAERNELLDRLRAIMAELKAINTTSNPTEQAAFADLETNFDAVLRQANVDLNAMVMLPPDLRRRTITSIGESVEAFDAALDNYREQVMANSAESRALAETNPLNLFVVAGIAMVIFFIILLVGYYRATLRHIFRLFGTSKQVAAGDYDQRVQDIPANEIGDILSTFNTLLDRVQADQQRLGDEAARARHAQEQAEEARRLVSEQLDIITAQRGTLRQLSVPIMPVGKRILALPLIGEFDAQRLEELTSEFLAAIAQQQPRVVILDFTGLATPDQATVAALHRLIASAGLLGTRVAIAGIRPDVAQHLISQAAAFDELQTFTTIDTAIAQLHAA